VCKKGRKNDTTTTEIHIIIIIQKKERSKTTTKTIIIVEKIVERNIPILITYYACNIGILIRIRRIQKPQ
jgi:hypothetical protein